MASSKARQMDMFLNGLHDSSGQPLKAYKVYFWTNSGASTEKTVWSDIDKTAVIDQSSGVTLGNKGELDVYGDGEYYVQVKTSAGVLHDSFTISYSSTVDFGGLYIDVGADFGTTGTNIQEALDSLNSLVNYTFLFKDADFVVGQDITFPSNVLIKGMITATINQTSGTLTINRTPDLPEFQFFTGTPSITWGSAVQAVKPIWTEGDATISSISYYKGIKYNTVSKTETYTASDESVILVDASSGAVTINLPAASGLSGREYTIKKTDSSVNAVTIDGNASETIDGETTEVIYDEDDSLTIICNGSNWHVVSKNINNYVAAYDDTSYLSNSKVIDRKRFWTTENAFNSNSVWTDVTPERIRNVPTGTQPVDIWNPKPIEDGKHKVYLKIELNGGGSAGDSLDVKIINDNSGTTIFEYTNISVGNPGTTTIYSLTYDLNDANVTSLNLGTSPLTQLSMYANPTTDNGWTIQAKRSAGSGTSGTFTVRSVEFLLVEV